jgi:cellulose biosynthesis protein BcsQ
VSAKSRVKDNVADLMISVESRKGGVGKTTAALCLARTLLRRGFSVLVLDMDVTGTNAADIAKSPFWIDDIHTIFDVNEKKNPSRPLNLV